MEHNWFILGDFETLGPFRWWENHHDGWSHSKKPCDRCGDIFEQQFSPRAGARVTPHIEEPQLFRCVAPRVVEIFLRGQRECCKYQNLRFWFLRNGMPPKGKNNQLHRSWDIFAFFSIVHNAVRHPTWLSPKMFCFYPWSMVLVCSRCSSKVKPASRGPKHSNTWWKQCPVKSQNDFQICPHKQICPDTHFPLGGCGTCK